MSRSQVLKALRVLGIVAIVIGFFLVVCASIALTIQTFLGGNLWDLFLRTIAGSITFVVVAFIVFLVGAALHDGYVSIRYPTLLNN